MSLSKRKTTLRRRCAAIQIDDASSLEETRDFFLSIMSEVVERDAQQHDELYSTSILRRRRRRLLHQESRLSVLLKGSRFSLSRTKESKWKKKKRGNSTLSFQNPKLLVYLGFWSKGLSFVFARQNTTRTHPTTEKTKNTTKNHRLLLLLLVVVVVARSLFFCIFFCFFCLSLSLSLSLFLLRERCEMMMRVQN